jgi:5-methyltetrahydropteroyltriglutamate--homocysteine methyltransferase
MQRSTNRILTTHVGSLVRPPELKRFIDAKQRGESFEQAEYETALKQAVAGVVRGQVEAGVDVVDDGEFGKSAWHNYIRERVTGYEDREVGREQDFVVGKDLNRFPDFYAQYADSFGFNTKRPVCVAPIGYKPEQLRRDIANFKAALEGLQPTEAFMPLVAPASFLRDAVNEYYPSEEAYVYAVADLMKQEYQAVIDAGFLLQVDDAVLATMWLLLEDQGLERYRKWAELRIEALNHALKGIPEERVRYHLCWGSWNGPHTNDVPLRDIVDLLLRVNAGAYSIEAANPRHHHEWRVWEDVTLPEGKTLIPGVISHATNIVEHPREVADRIVRFAGLVGRENVIAGTDCGFAQIEGIQRVYPSIMWAKLRTLAEGARLASEELFGG